MVDWTMTGASELGRMCRKTIADCFTPRARAARTWSLLRTASMEPRSSRAKIGICTIAMAMMTVIWLGRGASAAIDMASSSDGMESITSTTRMTNESTQPPKAPASVPRVSPPIRPSTVAPTPTMSVCWAPTSSRESRSRPRLSAPSGKPGSGRGIGLVCWRTLSSSRPCVGSCGAIHGEISARTTKARVMAAPTRKTGLRRSRRKALAMSETPGSLLDLAGAGHGAAPPAVAARLSMRSLRRSAWFFRGLLVTGFTSSGRGGR